MQIEMTLSGVMIDPLTNMPIVVLRNEERNQILPIWVGIFEANAIALKRENITTPRPMTHDLITSLLQTLEAHVTRIVVSDLKDNTFYALIHIDVGGTGYLVDSRPSDAIALALRTSARIFVEEDVLEKASKLDEDRRPEKVEARLKQWFESIDPDDLSKYEM